MLGIHDLLQYFNICDEVTPVNVEDGTEPALMKAFKQTDTAVVDDSGLQTAEESSKNYCPIDQDHSLVLQVSRVPKRACTTFQKNYLNLSFCPLSILTSDEMMQPR